MWATQNYETMIDNRVLAIGKNEKLTHTVLFTSRTFAISFEIT